jgi:hypothetical protein
MSITTEPEINDPIGLEEIESLNRLTRDLRKAAATLTPSQARFCVARYYQIQRMRITTANIGRTQAESPNEFINHMADYYTQAEKNIASALDAFAKADPRGKWLLSICGIGPVIAAGLLAHIDVTDRPTAGHVWRFAGLDPNVKWEKGQKRPFNANLKVLAWKAGESFVKVQNNDSDVYGKLYAKRKVQEWERNLAGDFAAQVKKVDKATDAFVWYAGCLTPDNARQYLAGAKNLAEVKGEPGTGTPMLPPAHIHSRSTRWAVKLFLSHVHHVFWETATGTPPPKPFALEHMGHVHYIPPPNWPIPTK